MRQSLCHNTFSSLGLTHPKQCDPRTEARSVPGCPCVQMWDVAELSIGCGLFCQSLWLLEGIILSSDTAQSTMPSRLAKSFPAVRVRIRMVRFSKRRSCGNGNSVHQPNLLAFGPVLADGPKIRETAFFLLPQAGVLGSRGQRRKLV